MDNLTHILKLSHMQNRVMPSTFVVTLYERERAEQIFRLVFNTQRHVIFRGSDGVYLSDNKKDAQPILEKLERIYRNQHAAGLKSMRESKRVTISITEHTDSIFITSQQAQELNGLYEEMFPPHGHER